MKNENISSQSFFRTFNGNCTNNSFDIYVDDKLFNRDLLYKDFSVYTPITAGKHTVALTLNGDSNIIINRDIYIKPYQIYTLIIAINSKTLSSNLYFIEDTRKKIPKDSCLVRIGNFCTEKEILELSFLENLRVFKKVFSASMSNYMRFNGETFTISTKYMHNKDSFISDTSFNFKPYRIYTIYILGDGSACYPFECLLSIDGSSFLSFSNVS